LPPLQAHISPGGTGFRALLTGFEQRSASNSLLSLPSATTRNRYFFLHKLQQGLQALLIISFSTEPDIGNFFLPKLMCLPPLPCSWIDAFFKGYNKAACYSFYPRS
jgi:hypothetical protein